VLTPLFPRALLPVLPMLPVLPQVLGKSGAQPLCGALSTTSRLSEGEMLLACDGDVPLMELSALEHEAIAAASSRSNASLMGHARDSMWPAGGGGYGAGRRSPVGVSSSAFRKMAGHGGGAGRLSGLDLASASPSKAAATRAAVGAKSRRVETGLQIRTKKERDADRRNKLKLGNAATAAAAAAAAAAPPVESIDLLGLDDGAMDEREFQKQGGVELFADIL